MYRNISVECQKVPAKGIRMYKHVVGYKQHRGIYYSDAVSSASLDFYREPYFSNLINQQDFVNRKMKSKAEFKT